MLVRLENVNPFTTGVTTDGTLLDQKTSGSIVCHLRKLGFEKQS